MSKWTNKDMLRFARIASEGAYRDYRGCTTVPGMENSHSVYGTSYNPIAGIYDTVIPFDYQLEVAKEFDPLAP